MGIPPNNDKVETRFQDAPRIEEPGCSTPEDTGGLPRETGDFGAEERQLQAWIALIVNHDQNAFASLYRAAAGRIYSLALHITGDAGMAEEATEDTFWQVWRQAPRFDPSRGRAMAWLVTIARSRALDLRRKLNGLDNELDREMLESIVSPQCDGPMASLMSEQGRNTLQAALAELDPVQRQLLALAYFRGLTHEEIAEFTSLPLGTVKAHLRRTLLRLRDSLTSPLGSTAINL
jgi:RNA polymerase sigma-70 factor (ECF subfamily)